MGWYDGGHKVLDEEYSVRLGENVLVAGIAFALFWASFGLSCVNSTIHAVVIVVGVAVALAHITWADGFLPMSSIRAASFIFSIAIGYFLCDLIIIIVWPVPMQWVFIVHHLVAVIPYFINNFISCCAACQFGLLLFLLVELATLPLNARGFLDARDRQDSRHYMRSIYATYVVWGLSRTALPLFVMYAFWAYAFPSDRNHDTCFFPNLVSAHLIALFCIGVFVFVHTPELIRLRREHGYAPSPAADSSHDDEAVHTDDADGIIGSDVADAFSLKAHGPSSSIRSLTLSLSRSKEPPVADDSYDAVELGVMPRSAREGPETSST